MSNFIKRSKVLFFLLAISTKCFAETASLPYDNEAFSSNPTPDGKGFYFIKDDKTKEYPKTCERFYELWEAKKYLLDIDVYNNNNSYYHYHLGECLFSKWIDFSKLNPSDNLLNKMSIRTLVKRLPAGVSIDDCKKTVTAEKEGKRLSEFWPSLKFTEKLVNDEIWFDHNGDYFRIHVLGSVSDDKMGKVYLVTSGYSAGEDGTYNTLESFLVGEKKNGTFYIVKRFPELECD